MPVDFRKASSRRGSRLCCVRLPMCPEFTIRRRLEAIVGWDTAGTVDDFRRNVSNPRLGTHIAAWYNLAPLNRARGLIQDRGSMNVSGKVAVVTGGGRGIGRGIVLVLARNGADVVAADINVEDAQSVAQEVADSGSQSMAVWLDVTDQQSVDRMAQEVIARFGRIDILVNNAGIIAASGWERRERPSEEDWDQVYEVNVKGVARVTEAVARSMKERRYGKIVNISSIAGRVASPLHPPYGASKAGVISLTQASARELAPFNVNVNAICPGLIWTPIWERIASHEVLHDKNVEGLNTREVFDLNVRDRTLLGREQTPEDIGNLAAFLASDYAENITGQAINVSGGSHFN